MLSYAEYQEVLQMRRELAVLRADWRRTVRDYYARKYRPDQPRVPAGSHEGGRWTGGGVSISASNDSSSSGSEFPAAVRLADASSVLNAAVISDASPAPYVLAGTSPASAGYCWNQMQIDMLYCGALRPTSVVAACRAQANERYSACMTGKPLPPLPF